MLSVPVGPSASHQTSFHPHSETVAIDDHGHSHDLEDDGASAETAGQGHDHVANDHSHEKFGEISDFTLGGPTSPSSRLAVRTELLPPSVASLIERPPRAAEVA
ncbi:hypothetical protein [Marinivivus vitaminiproducens]|uniref:hypothetical protein n=1 Tax=Marinivivus vitaminiproducens TaxID=3035935 RepID=UPI00279CCD23|nr:hypothetical protein P4R82_24755 [Geminicoccaceae bacterium SCSIO 64248]